MASGILLKILTSLSAPADTLASVSEQHPGLCISQEKYLQTLLEQSVDLCLRNPILGIGLEERPWWQHTGFSATAVLEGQMGCRHSP
jgi:hypothetical protein